MPAQQLGDGVELLTDVFGVGLGEHGADRGGGHLPVDLRCPRRPQNRDQQRPARRKLATLPGVFLAQRAGPHPQGAAIADIHEAAWVQIEYPRAIPDTGELISAAEIAEVPSTAFASKAKAKRVTARLIVRRIPERNQTKLQDPLFPSWRYHALFTDNPAELVQAESTHRRHAIIEQVIADLKNSALAHLPAGRFAANAAWLCCAAIAFNLTRALGVIAGGTLAKATTATIRTQIINLPARIARSARRLSLRLPRDWTWEPHWQRLWTAVMTT